MDINDFLVRVLIGVAFMSIIMLLLGLWSPDHHAKQLANAICKEKYGTGFDHFIPDGRNTLFVYTIEEVVCKEPIKRQEVYDGLIVKIE